MTERGRRLDAIPERPGDYGKVVSSDGVVHWFNWPPGAEHPGELKRYDDDRPDGLFHTVEEHDDGTITVHGSILQRKAVKDFSGPVISMGDWHGWLERGVWRSVSGEPDGSP